MPDTIESFVAKLQSEGVEAGRQEAEKLLAQARKEAEHILAEARQGAERTVADAQKEAQARLVKGRTELELAARDTVLRLRESLSNALRAVLLERTRQALADPEFLRRLIHDAVVQYALAQHEGREQVTINISPETRQQLTAWLLQELGQQKAGHTSVDLHSTLAEAGFEYRLDGETVEVTAGSLAETLSEMVNPELKKILDQATQQKAE